MINFTQKPQQNKCMELFQNAVHKASEPFRVAGAVLLCEKNKPLLIERLSFAIRSSCFMDLVIGTVTS